MHKEHITDELRNWHRKDPGQGDFASRRAAFSVLRKDEKESRISSNLYDSNEKDRSDGKLTSIDASPFSTLMSTVSRIWFATPRRSAKSSFLYALKGPRELSIESYSSGRRTWLLLACLPKTSTNGYRSGGSHSKR